MTSMPCWTHLRVPCLKWLTSSIVFKTFSKTGPVALLSVSSLSKIPMILLRWNEKKKIRNFLSMSNLQEKYSRTVSPSFLFNKFCQFRVQEYAFENEVTTIRLEIKKIKIHLDNGEVAWPQTGKISFRIFLRLSLLAKKIPPPGGALGLK